MAVNNLYMQSKKISMLILQLKNAGLMKKADIAQAVIEELAEMQGEQNRIINTLVNDLLNNKLEIDEIKKRVGL